MSGWGLGWFGGGAAKKKDAPKNAILQLRSTLEMLTKREKHLQNQMDEQDVIARKHVTSNKAGMYTLSHPTDLRLFRQRRSATHGMRKWKAANLNLDAS